MANFDTKQQKTLLAENSDNGVEKALSELSAGFKSRATGRSQFVTAVLSLSDDHSSAKVKLCTGSVIDVPTSILKNVTYLGTVTNDGESLGIASAEIDVSTDVGLLIYQMAQELSRVSRSLLATQEGLARLQSSGINKLLDQSDTLPVTRFKRQLTPSDTVLPSTAVKIPFQGIAGDPYAPFFIVYAAPPFQYIQDWEVISTQNCFFKAPPVIGGIDQEGHTTGLQFFPDAAHGTPLGSHYNGTVTLIVTLVQRTT